ncbi:origin recognition complex subunit 4 C-terminus-domain-containing protein [Gymnopilus junonius]|uniref:Origin recognition complex subunit 4 C-terminus-domain-containing protein n=1 Tax=Gymnopilus junonius TaxID=109634 RepID=A0A9P5P1X7_GYMJU|nr:origin recognition complex subunit 4 C-terminus-domain-containing protein [Gymnopilus junonius]
MPSPSSTSTDTSSALPEHLDFSLRLQKRAIFRSLRSSKQQTFNAEPSVNDIATRQLADLVDGTMTRAEGNSCLLLGPRSSGKSKMVEICIDNLLTKPIILRLSGWVQTTDRHALREIAFQLLQQTGSSLLSDSDLSNVAATGSSHEEENPFLVTQGAQPIFDGSILSLPPSSHLHSLIPALLTVNRPVVVILDAFDLFALHPRQSLLYCLLDTVQNCRASAESRGIAVIGMTSRVDTIQLLEKRVKSRFSGRTIRTASHSSFESYLTFVRSSLTATTHGKDTDLAEEWHKRWASSVEIFLTDKAVLDIFKETFNLSRDLKLINRILMACVLQLTPEQPYLTYNHVAIAIAAQQSRSSYLSFPALSYPSTCLLIASVHADTSGHPVFTFEMLFESFRDQVRSSMSAPVQVNGGSIGMAFEVLSAAKIFMPVAGTSSSVAREFMKHRCTLDRATVKKVVEQSGQVNLRKWFSKAQQS